MRRFARPISEAGSIAPRSADATEEQPPSHRTFARLVGAAGMVALTAVLFWLLTDATFRVTAANVELEGLHYADEAAVRARLAGLDRVPNAFRVRGSELVARLTSLPEVVAAEAIVTLPASVSVRIRERQPIFIWSDGRTEWLVDSDGRLFAPVAVPQATVGQPGADATGATASAMPGSDPEQGAGPAANATAATTGDQAADGPVPSDPPGATAPSTTREAVDSGLPRVLDLRTDASAVDTAGGRLPSLDLAVMRQLLALTPDDVGSPGSSLRLSVENGLGYILAGEPWQAIFGTYTPLLQGPEDVPRQVQCLRWLLADRGELVAQVRLAVSGDLCGTYADFKPDGGKPARTPRP